MDDSKNQSSGDPENQGETVSFVKGWIRDNSFVIPQTSDTQSIRRYCVIRTIGKGGFDRVYLAHDDDLNRPVAIKVPNPKRTELLGATGNFARRQTHHEPATTARRRQPGS
jgi:hypothetical protein